MRNRTIIAGTMLVLAAAGPGRAAAQSCAPIAEDAMNWITGRSRGPGTYWIAATMVTNQPSGTVAALSALGSQPALYSDGTVVGYAEGRLNLVGVAVPVGSPPPPPGQRTALTGTLVQLFSDRADPNLIQDRIQPFTVKRPDSIMMTVEASGRVLLTLRSWGNGVVTLVPTCTDQVMTAVGTGVGGSAPQAHYLITLRRGFTAP
ncbi:MAG TPA: hypothetical protein VF771_17750 [Longimicrobiaceae bacterium]